MKYFFEAIIKCEMCGSAASEHRVVGQRLNCSQGLRPKAKHGISVSVMRCKKCGLHFSNPMPIPENINDHYGIPPEDYWQANYFNPPPANAFNVQIATAKRLLSGKGNLKALDIGAGLGKTMITLANAGFDVFGFEPSHPFYERAISMMKIAPDRIRCGMIEEMDYEKESFDFITFEAVAEHLYHPAKSIQKALEWLKPGGIIHIEVPSSNHFISKLINLYYRLVGTTYVTNLSPMHVPFHLYEFTPRSFEEFGKQAGYKVAHHIIEVCNIDFFPRMLHPVLRKYMQITNTGMQLTIYLQKN